MRSYVSSGMTFTMLFAISRQQGRRSIHEVQASNLVPTFTSLATRGRTGRNGQSSQFANKSQDALFMDHLSAMDYDKLLPLDIPRRKEILIGLEAVSKACSVAKIFQPDYPVDLEGKKVNAKVDLGVIKADLSPVTIADFAVQALVLSKLHKSFEQDGFIAEESSESLQNDINLAESVLKATGKADWTLNDLFLSIDLGKMYKNEQVISKKQRIWTCDPIDGTRGFLRGRLRNGQYCVALSMIEDGIPVVGILGCPNLVAVTGDDWEDVNSDRGCVFVASAKGGSYQVPLFKESEYYCRKLRTSKRNENDARFCLGVEKYGNFGGKQSRIATILHGDEALDSNGEVLKALRMDSQVKYGVIARGEADIFLRFTKKSYQEWIWDHAAGGLVIAEAGGVQSDTNGSLLDFSQGAKLPAEVEGIIATSSESLHEKVIKSCRAIADSEDDS